MFHPMHLASGVIYSNLSPSFTHWKLPLQGASPAFTFSPLTWTSLLSRYIHITNSPSAPATAVNRSSPRHIRLSSNGASHGVFPGLGHLGDVFVLWWMDICVHFFVWSCDEGSDNGNPRERTVKSYRIKLSALEGRVVILLDRKTA